MSWLDAARARLRLLFDRGAAESRMSKEIGFSFADRIGVAASAVRRVRLEGCKLLVRTWYMSGSTELLAPGDPDPEN